jgi:hypothetical protein
MVLALPVELFRCAWHSNRKSANGDKDLDNFSMTRISGRSQNKPQLVRHILRSALAIVLCGRTLQTGRCTTVAKEDHGDIVERVFPLNKQPMLTREVAFYKQETTP